HLKTGTLRDVAAGAGYVLGETGRRHVPLPIIHHPNAPAARAAPDALVDWTRSDQPPPTGPAVTPRRGRTDLGWGLPGWCVRVPDSAGGPCRRPGRHWGFPGDGKPRRSSRMENERSYYFRTGSFR